MRILSLLFLIVFFSANVFAQKNVSVTKQFASEKLGQADEQRALNTNFNSTRGIFWSEYFSGGVLPAGWSNVDNNGASSTWICTDQPPGGDYSSNIPAMASTSGGYFMQLRGDYYNSPYTAPGITMDAYFQTPAIDCSDKNGVIVEFNQYFRTYGSSATWVLMVSNNGSTWTSFDLNNGISAGVSSANPLKMQFNISSIAANQPTVYLRWHLSGTSHYFWMVDDIELSAPPVNDIQLTSIHPEFYGIGFYSKLPSTLTQDLYLSGELVNFGTAAQTNVMLNGVVQDLSSNEVYNKYSTPIASIASEGIDSIGIDTAFSIPSDIKSYEAIFTMVQDETDENLDNNTESVFFDVTDTVFARDVAITSYTGPGRYTGGVDGDRVGVLYYFPADAELNSMTTYISSYSVENTSFRTVILTDDGAGNLVEILSTDIYVVAAEDIGTWVTVPFIKDGASEFITADAVVYACVEFYFEGIGDLYIGVDQTSYHDFQSESLLQLGGSNYWISMVPAIRLNINNSGLPLTSIIADKANASCNGNADGAAVVQAFGGEAPYTYLWSTGETNDTIFSLGAGTYTVTVTDNIGTTSVSTVTISEPNVLNIAYSVIDESVVSANDGEIDITVTGGTPPYIYSWSNGGFTQDQTGLATGTYTVYVEDDNGCLANLAIFVDVTVGLDNIDSEKIVIYPNPTNGILNVSNINNAKVEVYNIVGERVYTIGSSTNSISIDMNSFANGAYIVKVIDNENVITKKITLTK